jgi:hypothetical protein
MRPSRRLATARLTLRYRAGVGWKAFPPPDCHDPRDSVPRVAWLSSGAGQGFYRRATPGIYLPPSALVAVFLMEMLGPSIFSFLLLQRNGDKPVPRQVN